MIPISENNCNLDEYCKSVLKIDTIVLSYSFAINQTRSNDTNYYILFGCFMDFDGENENREGT